jgi:DNA-binding transcriptional MerR regulator/methylmalonyl-CoA mutase cobalamin-binding subunit
MSKVHHSINMAARKSGLTPHVIRVWERRYGAVTPTRTDTNRRLYSEAEIERLSLLRQAVSAGYRISNIATLDAPALRELLIDAPTAVDQSSPASTPTHRPAGEDFEARCLDAIQQMDAHALDDIITRALIVFGHQGLLRNVIAPLTQALGDLWSQGSITAAHEHFASAFLRNFLSNAARPFAITENTPCIVVATPHGQLHELGATMIASAARNQGWRVVYLGASLPAAEIAGAAAQNKARAVALSLVYPTDDPHMAQELSNLRRYLPASIRILAGGRASHAYAAPLKAIGALTTEDLDMFCEHLENLRKPSQFQG